MHPEILSAEQKEILPFLSRYSKQFYLAGGTAIALQLGHRRSIDFDLFTLDKINPLTIKRQISTSVFSSSIIHQDFDQIHFSLNKVKLTFFQYPFPIEATINYNQIFRMPDLLTLGAMKAFALGGRGKWKDYADIYFLLKNNLTVTHLIEQAKLLFQDAFNASLFQKQLCYFKDVNYSESIEFMPGFETDEKTIKDFLTKIALEEF